MTFIYGFIWTQMLLSVPGILVTVFVVIPRIRRSEARAREYLSTN